MELYEALVQEAPGQPPGRAQVGRLGGGRQPRHQPPDGGQDHPRAEAVRGHGRRAAPAEARGREPDGGLGLPQLPRSGQDPVRQEYRIFCYNGTGKVIIALMVFF